MKMRLLSISLAGLAIGGIAISQTMVMHWSDQSSPKVSNDETERLLAGWLPKPREVARKMIAKYGMPNEATQARMVWWNSGPWKYTELTNEEITHNFPMPHKDMLLQCIDFQVRPERVDNLAAYDGSVIYDRTPGELSARCDKEEANFLAINLANDVATSKRSAAKARDFYAKTIKAMMDGSMNDEQKRYTSGFVFDVPRAGTAFADTSMNIME